MKMKIAKIIFKIILILFLSNQIFCQNINFKDLNKTEIKDKINKNCEISIKDTICTFDDFSAFDKQHNGTIKLLFVDGNHLTFRVCYSYISYTETCDLILIYSKLDLTILKIIIED